MAAIDLFTHPGQPGVDPARQKALLVAWLLLNSNSFLLHPQTRIVNSDPDLAKAKSDGTRPGSLVNYLDLRDVYPLLAPLTQTEVEGLFTVARNNPEFQVVSNAYWTQGHSILFYDDHYCLALADVLSLNG